MNETHEGWSNYATWGINLYVKNERGPYEYWRNRTAEIWAEAAARGPQLNGRAWMTLADELKDWVEEKVEGASDTLTAHLIQAGLSQVNWAEIAKQWITELRMEG